MNHIITVSDLRARFDVATADMSIDSGARVAAVAIAFWCDADELRVCLVRRAISTSDPWSGDMAFPGGKAEPLDRSLCDVAARETFEEVGLLLPPETLIGRMARVDASGAAGLAPTPVWPLVYLLTSTPAPFRLGEEMSEAHWVSLQHLWERKNWITFSFPGDRSQRPGISIDDHFLWGFSLRVLIALSDILGRSLRPLLALETVSHYENLPFNSTAHRQ